MGSLKAEVSVKDPVRPVAAAETGAQFIFETADLEGNAVKSADFEKYRERLAEALQQVGE